LLISLSQQCMKAVLPNNFVKTAQLGCKNYL